MTVLGKILVFVNLVASLLTAGFIAMAFTTRTNWQKAYAETAARVTTINANAKAEVEEVTGQLKALEAQVKKREGEKVELTKSVDAEKDSLKAKLAEMTSIQEALAKATQNTKDLTAEVERRKVEVEGFNQRLNERDAKISDIDRQLAKLRDEKTRFETQYQIAKERNEQLRQQSEALKLELAQLKAQVGNTTSTASASTKAAPPDDVRGTIRRIDGDLATISIGTDAGVNVNNVLQVYRMNPPEYLGTIQIIAASPQSSVGRLSGVKKSQVRVNDEVAANVLK